MIAQTVELRALVASLGRGDTPVVLGFAADGAPFANNQLAGLAAKIAVLEGLAGIPGGANLAQDVAAAKAAVAAFRSTFYWSRPGEAIDRWTASINAASAVAVPLAATGAYSIVPTTMGPALRITGIASARPLAQIPLDDTQVEEFRATIKRGADDATNPANPANNAPVFVFGCFKADGTDNGTVALPADPLTAAQGFKTFVFRASLVAGLGTVDLPAGTRRVNLISGGKGTGSIDVVSVERGSQPLTSAPLITNIADTDLIASYSASGRLPSVSTFADLIKQLEARLGEKFYSFPNNAKVGAKSVLLVPNDPDLNGFDITNNSVDQTLLVGEGQDPVEGSEWTTLLLPGGGNMNQKHPPKLALYAKAKAGECPVRANYTNSSGIDVLKNALVDAWFASANYAGSAAERAAYSDYLNALKSLGALGNMSTLYIHGGPSRTLSKTCIIRNAAFTEVAPTRGAIAWTKYKGFTPNGTDEYAKTGYVPASDGRVTASLHALGTFVDNLLATTAASVMGSYWLGLSPNRGSSTSAGFRSGFNSNRVLVVDDKGGSFALSRSAADRYRAQHGQNIQEDPTAATSLGSNSYEMFLFAQNSLQGTPAGFSGLTPLVTWAGAPQSDAQLKGIDTANIKLAAALAALPAGV